MQLRNTSTGYGLIAQLLHWAVAGLILYQYLLAERAEQATLFQKLGILATHKSIGITILGLSVIRLAWRLGAGPSPSAADREPVLRARLARLSHGTLYALTIAMPVSGWIMSSSANTPVSYFGRITLPNLVKPRQSWVDPLTTLHGALFVVLASFVAVHVLAAVYHQLVLRDVVLRRMIPFMRVPP